MTAEFGSLANPIDVQNAVDAIVSGGYVSVQYHGVFIMVFSGVNLVARHETLRVKNEEDTGKPLSSISFSAHIFPSVDLELIQQPAAKRLLSDISQRGGVRSERSERSKSGWIKRLAMAPGATRDEERLLS